MPFTRTAAIYTVPDLTLGLTNSEGSSDGIRADAGIALFDTTVPTTAAAADSAATGSAAIAARRDHLHGMPSAFTTFVAPALTLGTSNVEGSGDSIRSGATLLAFDATNPAAIGTAATGSAVVSARRDHVHGPGSLAAVNVQIFTSDGTWTKPTGVQALYIECCGGGGGGGAGHGLSLIHI